MRGGGEVTWAMPERKHFFCWDLGQYHHIASNSNWLVDKCSRTCDRSRREECICGVCSTTRRGRVFSVTPPILVGNGGCSLSAHTNPPENNTRAQTWDYGSVADVQSVIASQSLEKLKRPGAERGVGSIAKRLKMIQTRDNVALSLYFILQCLVWCIADNAVINDSTGAGRARLIHRYQIQPSATHFIL